MLSLRRFLERARGPRRCLQLTLICSLAAIVGSCVNPRPDSVERHPPAPPPTFERAVADYYRGSFFEAISTLKAIVRNHPSDTRSRWELANLLEESGSYPEAIRVLESLRPIASDSARVENSLFVARVLGGELSDAESMLPLSKPTYRTLFYEGLLSMNLGNSKRATKLLEDSLAVHAHQPMAWFFLGSIALSSGDYRKAQSDFEKVRRQNAGLTIAIPPLARSVLAQGKEKEAYPLLLRARDILPDNAAIKREIARLHSKYPELAKAQSEAAATRQRETVPPTVTTFPARSALAPYIRVALAEHLHSLTIKTGGRFEIRGLGVDAGLTYRGKGEQVLKLRRSGSEMTLSRGDAPPFLSWTSPVALTYSSPACTTVIFDLLTEAGSFFATSGDRAYRGQMIFLPGPKGFTVINRLPLEEYLYSVLPSEMYSFWPIEALKAQAVAARSYTLASMGAFSKKGFDVYGSVRSAAYQGVGNESQSTTNAINSTQGQILEYHGKPLKAYYSANSGGFTENSTVVWGESGGMKAVPDILVGPRDRALSLTELRAWLESDPASYSAIPPYFSQSAYRWVKWVPASEISRRAARIKEIGELLSIITRGRGISGRVAKVELIGTKANLTVTGDGIRSVLGNLRSTLFTERPELSSDGLPRYFIFTGGGWGHGVGMDQDGAAGMASAGYTYQQILSHYYPLATLETDKPNASIGEH